MMGSSRAKFAPVRCLRAKQKDGVYRPFCFAGGDNKSFAAGAESVRSRVRFRRGVHSRSAGRGAAKASCEG